TGELKRYSDVRTGNFFPAPLPNEPKTIVFSSFNKGSFQIFKSEFEGEVEKTVTFVDRPAEEELERFEPIISLEINKEKIKPYKGMSKLYLTQRPPVDTIVSTDGSLYGGSALSFSDLMGDYTFYLMAYQVRSFRSYYVSFMNQKSRLQYMASAFQYTQFYYGYYGNDPSFYNPYLTYRDAMATRKITGININAFYPFSRYYRAQGGFGYYNYEEDYLYASPSSGPRQFLNGNILQASFSLVGETTRFNYYGPMSGNTFRLSISQALPISDNFIRNTTLEADLRQYLYLGMDTLLALRFEGFASRGRDPFLNYYGGNNQVRSVYYYSIYATESWFANAEFRFPLVNAASTLIGQIGPVRGVFFFDITRSKIKGYPAKIYDFLPDGSLGVFDAIGSYGYGFEFFLLGIPIHLEFVKKLGFQNISKPWDFDKIGNFETKFWIGFDF
ncbi:MAG: hypothetical protein V3U91_03850, partial [Candidatus Aminicenantaceae bacterium]